MRLDKYLAQMSVGTRSEVKKIIKSGRVFVNGIVAEKPEYKVDEQQDEVEVDGKSVGFVASEYFMLYKPQGVVSATKDNLHKTVLDLVPQAKRKDLFPVGRLDIDTEGLLLITNDGELSHKLLSPGKHVPKTYLVHTEGIVTNEDVFTLETGVDIGDETLTKPAAVSIIERKENQTILELTISEGRYHQIKRMLQKVGKPVIFLKRLSMGSLCLDKNLEPGQCRELTKEELKELK